MAACAQEMEFIRFSLKQFPQFENMRFIFASKQNDDLKHMTILSRFIFGVVYYLF